MLSQALFQQQRSHRFPSCRSSLALNLCPSPFCSLSLSTLSLPPSPSPPSPFPLSPFPCSPFPSSPFPSSPSPLSSFPISPSPTSFFAPSSLPAVRVHGRDLSYNQLSGTVPEQISALTAITNFDLSHNDLSGPLPTSISRMTDLKAINLSGNEFTGSIPAEYSNLASLQVLSVPHQPSLSPCPPPHEPALLPPLLSFPLCFPSPSALLPPLRSFPLCSPSPSALLPVSHSHSPVLTGPPRPPHSSNPFPHCTASPLFLSIPTFLSPQSPAFQLYDFENSLSSTLHPRSNLCCNQISGTLPTIVGGLLKLEAIDLSNNLLHGTIPTQYTGLVRLTLLNLNNNQLTGPILEPIPASLTVYNLDNNYFSSGFSSPPNCAQGSISFRFNCLETPPDGYSCPTPAMPSAAAAAVQRPEALCAAFCGVSAADPPCGGHGLCYLEGPSRVPKCDCESGFVSGELPGSCVAEGTSHPTQAKVRRRPNGRAHGSSSETFSVLNYQLILHCLSFSLLLPSPILPSPGPGSGPVTLQPTAAQISVKGRAAVASDGTVTLTAASQLNTWGAAFLQLPVSLFSFALKASACGRPLAFTVYFSFSILKTAASNAAAEAGDGFAFVIAASDSVTGGSSGSSDGSGGGGSLGYAGMDERSIAVEFDTSKSTDANDPESNHVGLSVSGKTSSIATAKAPLTLNDGKPKHTWLVFDPSSSSSSSSGGGGGGGGGGTGSLQVFLSASASPKPSKAVLSEKVSLCHYLKPTAQGASFHMGFTASASDSPQQHSILAWNVSAGQQFGFQLSEASLSPMGANPFFRYASLSEASLSPMGANPFFRYASAGVQALQATGGAGVAGGAGVGGGGGGEQQEVWVVSQAFSWADLGLPWPVQNQGACGDCWAYAVVCSIEMAYGILSNLSAVPLLSVSQLRDALGSSCSQGNSPSQAFQYLVNLNAKSKVGLTLDGRAGAVANGGGRGGSGSRSGSGSGSGSGSKKMGNSVGLMVHGKAGERVERRGWSGRHTGAWDRGVGKRSSQSPLCGLPFFAQLAKGRAPDCWYVAPLGSSSLCFPHPPYPFSPTPPPLPHLPYPFSPTPPPLPHLPYPTSPTPPPLPHLPYPTSPTPPPLPHLPCLTSPTPTPLIHLPWPSSTSPPPLPKPPLPHLPCPPPLSPCQSKPTGGPFRVSGFERTAFHGWFGLLLAVQQQPVVVHVQAIAPSFLNYDGVRMSAHGARWVLPLSIMTGWVGPITLMPPLPPSSSTMGVDHSHSCTPACLHAATHSLVCMCAHTHTPVLFPCYLSKYADPSCFTYNLNHVVLLVGYRLTGLDPTFPHMAPPFWIIRNSWGPEWGDSGHMRMDIQGGDGVCGINTLPGIYPVVRAAKDPCNVNGTTRGLFGPLFNPCGNFTCTPTPDGASNHCDCTDPRFVEALQPDNSRTCAYNERSPLDLHPTNPFHFSLSPCPPSFLYDPLHPISLPTPNPNIRALLFPVPCSPPALPPVPLSSFIALPSLSLPSPQGDTCESLASYFSLYSDDCPTPTEPCAEAFQALNPGLDCASSSGELVGSQAVCVERRAESAAALLIPVCSQFYLVQARETCDQIRSVPSPPLSPLEFFRLNPGIKCSRLVPKTDVGSLTGFEVSLCSPSALPLLSLCSPSTLPLLSLSSPSALPLLSLYSPSALPLLSLYSPSALPLLSLYSPSALPLLSLYSPSALPLLSLCSPLLSSAQPSSTPPSFHHLSLPCITCSSPFHSLPRRLRKLPMLFKSLLRRIKCLELHGTS
ncbi:unnamed protein product [Closterium sp. NIES-64]|nr:unnamed protein product [Closterium sp. NIES-64]